MIEYLTTMLANSPKCHKLPDQNSERMNSQLLPLAMRRAKRYTYHHGGDVGSTGVGSQSGMPGFCYPVKQTDLQT